MVLNIRKIIALLLSIIIFIPSPVIADTNTSTTGYYTLMNKGDIAPFSGLLLDPLSTAIVLTDKEQKDKEFNTDLQYRLSELKLSYKLQIDNLSSDLSIEKELNKEIIKIKDKQINETQKMLDKTDWSLLYISIAGVLGIVLGICGVALYERIK